MGWKKPAGYLLPEGEAFTEDLACALVYFPDKPEYRRALRGSLDFLATWTAWETDPLKRGKDAARAWKLANELTQECIEMGVCLEDLIAEVKKIKLNAVYNVDCFCEAFHINPPIPDITDIPSGTPFPPIYAGTEITSQDQYRRAVCFNANKYVDILKEQNQQLLSLLELGTVAVGLIAAILAIMSAAGLLIAIAYGLAASVFTSLVALASWEFLADVPSDLENARAEIVEAIVCGYPLAPVIEDAIDTDAWTAFYQWVDWSSAAATIRSGSNSGQDLEYGQDGACVEFCPEQPFTLNFTFDTDGQGWQLTGGQWNAPGYIRISVGGTGSNNYIRLNLSTVWSLLTLDTGTEITFQQFSADVYDDGLTLDASFLINLNTDPSSIWISEPIVIPDGSSARYTIDIPPNPMTTENDSLRITGLRNGVAGQNIGVDNVTITGFYTPVI
jgi:hypothetical protein